MRHITATGYKIIAKALQKSKPIESRCSTLEVYSKKLSQWQDTKMHLAWELHEDNLRFSIKKFLDLVKN
jgi:hypothetical protein